MSKEILSPVASQCC